MQRFQIGISLNYRRADNFFCKLVCFSRIGKLKQADHFCCGAVNRDLFFSSADRKVGNGTVAENGIRDIRIPFQLPAKCLPLIYSRFFDCLCYDRCMEAKREEIGQNV